MLTATRHHDFSYGHRVLGHENKCKLLHGHNGRVTFVCAKNETETDKIGRVIDFNVIKLTLCQWIEDNWDHKFLLYHNDPVSKAIFSSLNDSYKNDTLKIWNDSIVLVPFNPTAENMAKFLVTNVGPKELKNRGVRLISCTIEETRKCSATYRLSDDNKR